MRATLAIVSLFALTKTFCQGPTPIVFTDYGPAAFESFWRFYPETYATGWQMASFTRFSQDRSSNNYLTQYFQISAPISSQHSLQIRTPYHYFSVSQSEATRLNMRRTSGASWGDIDILFNIRILSSLIPNQSLKLFLSGEMHTAPTNRDDRQFTDTIKLLGNLIAQYALVDEASHWVNMTIGIGGGGWQDNIVPRQNHIFKTGATMSYGRKLKRSRISFGSGFTFLAGEKNNDQGYLLGVNLKFWPSDYLNFHMAVRQLAYRETLRKTTNQFELGAAFTPSFLK